MQPTALLCHAQEALQRARAADTKLESVRDQANSAAAAWAKEAALAEKREARKAAEARAAEQRVAATGRTAREFSENPDRGFSEQG